MTNPTMQEAAEMLAEARATIAERDRRIAELEGERELIIVELGCHKAFILESISDLTSKVDEIPNADAFRQMRLRADTATKALAEMRERIAALAADDASVGQICDEAFKSWYYKHGADWSATSIRPVWQAAWDSALSAAALARAGEGDSEGVAAMTTPLPDGLAIIQSLLDKIYSVAEEHNDRSCDYDVCKEVRDARKYIAANAAAPDVSEAEVEAAVLAWCTEALRWEWPKDYSDEEQSEHRRLARITLTAAALARAGG